MAEDWRHKYQSHRIGPFIDGVAAVYFEKVRWVWVDSGPYGENMDKVRQVDVERIVGYVNTEGVEVIPLGRYGSVGEFRDGLAGFKLNGKYGNGKYGFINTEGKEVVPPKYDKVRIFSEGLAGVKLNGLWGVIDKEGEAVVPIKYDLIGGFRDGLAQVELNGKWGVIDKEGNEYWDMTADEYWQKIKNPSSL